PKPPDDREDPERQAHPLRASITLKPDAQDQIARYMPEAIPDIVERLLRKTGLRTDDIDAIVFHQPSEILVRAWAQR
ncbi:3-ketoacyl-ACP synthase, partial [Burkholderia pseudomallei]